MAKKSGTKKAARKAARKKRAAPRKGAPGKGAGKTVAKKSKKTSVKKQARKSAVKKPAVSKKPKVKAGAKRVAAKGASAKSLQPKLPAHRPLTVGVVLRGAAGSRPRAPERIAAKPGRAQRKVNLRTGIARPTRGRTAVRAERPQGPWPTPGETASETALRERILVFLLAAQSPPVGEDAAESPIDSETGARCLREMQDWLRSGVALRDGRTLDPLLFEALVADELSMLRETVGFAVFNAGNFAQARENLLKMTQTDSFRKD